MKKHITYGILAALMFVCCRKTRTCSCSISGTTVKTTTPRNGGGAALTTSSSSSGYKVERSYPAITKKNLRRYEECNSRVVNSTNTYTESVSSGTNDVTEDNTIEYSCKIK